MRSRARAALTELGGADPDRNVGLTDYLLGQADPIGRAERLAPPARGRRRPRARHDPGRAAARAVPAAELPRLPGEPRRGRFARRARGTGAEPDARSAGHDVAGRSELSESQTRLLAIAASAGVIADRDRARDHRCVRRRRRSTALRADERRHDDHRLGRADPDRRADSRRRRRRRRRGRRSASQRATSPTSTSRSSGLDPAPQGKTYVIWLMLTRRQGLSALADRGAAERQLPEPLLDPLRGPPGRRPRALRRRLDRAGRRRPQARPRGDQEHAASSSTSPATRSCGGRSRRPQAPSSRRQ